MKMFNSVDYQKEANQIIKKIKDDFILPDGSLSISAFDGYLAKHSMWPDLGDWLPFFLYWGETGFVDKQLEVLPKFLKNNLLISDFNFLKTSGWSKSYEYTDFLLGFLDYHVFMHDEKSEKLFFYHLDHFLKTFYHEKKIGSFYHQPSKILLPIIDTRDSTVVEILLDAYHLNGDKHYLDRAEFLVTNLFDDTFFKKYNLLPNFIGNIFFQKFKRFNQAQICKNNTNTLFALLSILHETKNNKYKKFIDLILESIFQKACILPGGIVYIFDHQKQSQKASLTASFAVLDFLCDYYFYNKEANVLQLAKNVADFWINLQGKTGLFPIAHDSRASYFDSETDMAVALYKLAELTGDSQYFVAAENCFAGIMQYHCQQDYPLSVDIDTGQVINKAQKTKYLTLFLKLLILKNELSKNESIYKNTYLFNLLKDR